MFADAEISASATGLARVFEFIFALAIGEAFKQFVAESPKSAAPDPKSAAPDPKSAAPDPKSAEHIQWERLPALIALMVLIVPFFHGMSRLFHDIYSSEKLATNYGSGLLIDFFVCTTLAAMFFVLSRSLPSHYLRRFYSTVCVLLILDILWIAVHVILSDLFKHVDQREMGRWAVINIVMVVVLAVVLYGDKIAEKVAKKTDQRRFPLRLTKFASTVKNIYEIVENKPYILPYILTSLMFLRTVCDYWVNWLMYFPAPS